MIKLGLLHIEEFRGIRGLDVDFNYESFAVHGPNGSGKSGVVDAIGFVLTGTIARLAGAGTGSVSIKAHGPHVKSKANPDAARVSLTFKDMKSGEVGTVTRTVKDYSSYTLSPDTPALRAALEETRKHPELTLSRREIIKFILAEPGKRAAEVQALLQLDKLEVNRRALKAAHNKLKDGNKSATSAVNDAKQKVEVHLAIEALTPDKVRDAINPHRKVLGLEALSEVKLSTNLKEGLDETTQEKPFDKESALRELTSYETQIKNVAVAAAITDLLTAMAELSDGRDLELLKSRSFLETGLALIANEGICPLCDTPWHTPDELRSHLQSKIDGSKELSRIDGNIRAKALVLRQLLVDERNLLKAVHTLSISWSSTDDQDIFQKRLDLLLEIDTLLKETQTTLGLKERLGASVLDTTAEEGQALTRLREVISKQPDTSEKAKSRNHIIIAAERWDNFVRSKANEVAAERAETRGKIVYDAYCEVTDKALEDLYTNVQNRFSAFYSRINNEDEATFKGAFKPTAGKLDLLVDFYGLGMFPPGAYHSEGHQDGMGICLYLALIEHILGVNFSLAVLDDVVMSVDVNHRRQFCELLKKEFPNTQFIITTHDEIWAKQMQTTGLIKSKSDIRFRGWSVDNGPIYEQGQVFWDKIDEDLSKDDVPGAAHKLRRGLEAELPDVAEALGAPVTYRGDAKYELGELLDAVKGRHGDLLKKANESASSWNNKTQQAEVARLKGSRAAAVLTQDRENWVVNLQVHYNWSDLTAAEFRPVVDAYHEFLKLFTCTNSECETWIAVKGQPGREEALRCRCGEYNLNLIKK